MTSIETTIGSDDWWNWIRRENYFDVKTENVNQTDVNRLLCLRRCRHSTVFGYRPVRRTGTVVLCWVPHEYPAAWMPPEEAAACWIKNRK